MHLVAGHGARRDVQQITARYDAFKAAYTAMAHKDGALTLPARIPYVPYWANVFQDMAINDVIFHSNNDVYGSRVPPSAIRLTDIMEMIIHEIRNVGINQYRSGLNPLMDECARSLKWESGYILYMLMRDRLPDAVNQCIEDASRTMDAHASNDMTEALTDAEVEALAESGVGELDATLLTRAARGTIEDQLEPGVMDRIRLAFDWKRTYRWESLLRGVMVSKIAGASVRDHRRVDRKALARKSPVLLDGRSKGVAKRVALVLDTSGSMDVNELDAVITALSTVVSKVRPKDVTAFLFHSSMYDVVPSRGGRMRHEDIHCRVHSGGTEIHKALMDSRLREYRPDVVIILSDFEDAKLTTRCAEAFDVRFRRTSVIAICQGGCTTAESLVAGQRFFTNAKTRITYVPV